MPVRGGARKGGGVVSGGEKGGQCSTTPGRDAGLGDGGRGGRSVGITKNISFHKIKRQYLEIIVIFSSYNFPIRAFMVMISTLLKYKN